MAEPHLLDVVYAAGIIDGEGSIGISELRPNYEPGNRRKRRKSPSFRCWVQVTMTDPVVPVWLAETFGGTANTREHLNPPANARWKPYTVWVLQHQRASEFCALVLPFLRVKKEQAELVISYYADPRFTFKQRKSLSEDELDARREYAVQARALNGRGGQ